MCFLIRDPSGLSFSILYPPGRLGAGNVYDQCTSARLRQIVKGGETQMAETDAKGQLIRKIAFALGLTSDIVESVVNDREFEPRFWPTLKRHGGWSPMYL